MSYIDWLLIAPVVIFIATFFIGSRVKLSDQRRRDVACFALGGFVALSVIRLINL